MNIIIAGSGKEGETIGLNLAKQNHSVTIIDKNKSRLDHISSFSDIMVVEGDCCSYNTLQEANIEKTDILIAVTEKDEINLLCCLIANKANNCMTIARVRNKELNENINSIKEKLNITMIINPDLITAKQIAKVLYCPIAKNITSVFNNDLNIIEYYVTNNSMLNGMFVKEIHREFVEDIIVCTVKRGDVIQIPDGFFELKVGDVISVITTNKGLNKFNKKLSDKSKHISSVFIVGGSKIAYYLANILAKNNIRVNIVESNRETAEFLCKYLPQNVNIILGDGTNKELLIEEGLNEFESFVSLTNLDESNLFMSLYAKQNVNMKKVITKVDHIEFSEIVDNLNVGNTINPKKLTSNCILQFVNAIDNSIVDKHAEVLYSISNKTVNVIEFVVKNDDVEIKDKLIKDIKIKSNILIGCIIRDKNIIIPKGDAVIQVNDKIVIVTINKNIEKISDILLKVK